MKYVIPGGSGFLGAVLAAHLQGGGQDVVVLSRSPMSAPWKVVHWDGKHLDKWIEEVDGSDVVINLAGKSVNCRYNQRNKAEIYSSRLDSTYAIGKAIQQASKPPKVWLNSSTATIYRHATDRPMDEESGELGQGFSVDVAKKWEKALFSAETGGIRKVALRSAIVMGLAEGSAFWHQLTLARKGLGGSYGTGRQYVSWIHIEDWLRAIDWIVDHPGISGAVNVSAPNPITNREFMNTLRQAAGISFGLPLYRWMLEIGALFLQTETELLLKSRWVLPTRLLESGFKFEFPTWDEAVKALISRAA